MRSMRFDWKKFDFFLLFAAAASLLALLYPGNTVWLGDEARLMALALDANGAGRPAVQGLSGDIYGLPVVWLNQALLLFSADPVTVTAVKTVLLLLLTWGALLKLARLFYLPAGPGAALWLCSPFVWFFLRMPWSHVWLPPLSLWSAVCFGLWLREAKMFRLAALAFLSLLMFVLSPVSVVIPAGFLAGAAVFRPEPFRARPRRAWSLFGGMCLIAAAGFPLSFISVRSAAPQYALQEVLAGCACCWRNLTAFGFSDRFAPETGLSLPGMAVMASVPVLLFFAVLGAVTAVRRWRRGELNLFDRLTVCCGFSILIFCALSLVLHVELLVHQTAVVAFAWLLLAWRGFAAFRSDYRKTANALLGGALLLELIFIADFSRQIEEYAGGGSEYFGTTLSRQWQVARSLTAARQANPELSIELGVERLKNDPAPLQVLIRLALQSGTLPEVGRVREAKLLPARRGSGIDLVLMQ